MNYSKQVSRWQPDKVADQIADAIYQSCFLQDEFTICSINVMICNTTIILSGQLRTTADVDIDSVVETTCKRLNVSLEKILNFITDVSKEIVDCSENFTYPTESCIIRGYASSDSRSRLIPSAHFANKVMREYQKIVEDSENFHGDANVIVKVNDYNPYLLEQVILSVNHSPKLLIDDVRAILHRRLSQKINANMWVINAADTWLFGGTTNFVGVSGRKSILDNYGSELGNDVALSGKDIFNIKRLATYASRKIAVDYVNKNSDIQNLNKAFCEIELTYQIHEKYPIYVRGFLCTASQNKAADYKDISEEISKTYDLSIQGMRKLLGDVSKINFVNLSSGCHFYNNYFGATYERF